MNRFVLMGLFALGVLVSSFSQILLKKSANKNYSGLRIFLNLWTILGYGIFFIVTLCAILLYRFLELSTGALIESLSYIFVPTLSWIFFKEKLAKRKFIGIAFIIAGIVVFAVFG